ncbi:MAG TPA: CvpA family protein [Paludibacteraceae bacterium]|nr:CvpA family protein [Paludibacteraceae bacterium]HPT42310.1 CvpA family protein [Paludibacteraceae bacterium]
MNTFDLFIFIPITLGLIFGLFRGFVKEVVSLVAVILAIVAAEIFSSLFSDFLAGLFNVSNKVSATMAYVFVFIITIVIALLIARMAEKLISNISLGWLNSLLGGVFGALKFAFIISVLMNVFDAIDTKFHLAKPETKIESVGYYPVLKLAPSLWKHSKEAYQKSKTSENEGQSTSPENEAN